MIEPIKKVNVVNAPTRTLMVLQIIFGNKKIRGFER